LAELAEWAAQGLLGEITLVIEGAAIRPASGTPQEWVAAVAVEQQAGTPRKEAIKAVAVRFGVPKREVFDALVAQPHP
jgi:16S rRNA (cytidine1402-2'-O)-methyltransferase